jgi:hypothetical protein
MKARTIPPVISPVNSWVPCFFDKDGMPGIEIGNLNKGTGIYADAVDLF